MPAWHALWLRRNMPCPFAMQASRSIQINHREFSIVARRAAHDRPGGVHPALPAHRPARVVCDARSHPETSQRYGITRSRASTMSARVPTIRLILERARCTAGIAQGLWPGAQRRHAVLEQSDRSLRPVFWTTPAASGRFPNFENAAGEDPTSRQPMRNTSGGDRIDESGSRRSCS